MVKPFPPGTAQASTPTPITRSPTPGPTAQRTPPALRLCRQAKDFSSSIQDPPPISPLKACLLLVPALQTQSSCNAAIRSLVQWFPPPSPTSHPPRSTFHSLTE